MDSRGTAAGGRQVRTRERTIYAVVKSRVCSELDDNRRDLIETNAQLVDTRRWEHFRGIAPDPRGLASGHILGSKNVPYHLLFKADGTYRELGSLESIFAAERVTLNAPIIATCGSGTSTARVLLAADLLGARDLALYNASWSEWGGLADTPKRMGPGFHGEP
jgi:thiosulfate/3-mercaptopyruvate sulfurtransferase